MTVSWAVRVWPNVSPASRRKALAPVKGPGHIPNPAAQLLVSRVAPGPPDDRIIGTILSQAIVIPHSYFAGISQGSPTVVALF